MGKALQPSVMTSVEVPYDVEEDRMIGVRGGGTWKICSTTPLKYRGNALLDIKINTFLDRREQPHLLFQ